MTPNSHVTLIRPPAIEAFRFTTTSITPPLGLAYIAAALEAAGHDIDIVDAVAEAPETQTRYFRGYCVGLRLNQIVERISPDTSAIGISVIFTHEWPIVAKLISLIKEKYPAIPVILGGEHVTSLPEFCLITSLSDYLVLGEGEEIVIELLEALANKKPLLNVDGIAYRDGDHVMMTKRRARSTEIDNISVPAWHMFDLDTYHKQRFVGGMYSPHMTVPILATRGCPYQCTYCSAPNMWTPKWIPRNPQLVVDEIEHYVNAFGARNFPFQDLTAIIQKDWIIEFCQEILKRKLDITWQLPTGTRSEAIDAEVAMLLKQSGMTSMAYAPESGSDLTRKLIKKKMKAEKLFTSIDAAQGAGLNVAAYLVIGFPHDRIEHFQDNLPFIDKLIEHGITDLAVGFYMALPGTELFYSLYDSGRIKLDRDYFSHILAAQAIAPSQTYSDLSKLQLTMWKWRMFLRFYGGKMNSEGDGRIFSSIVRFASGLIGSGDHDTKLQTAAWNGIHSLWSSVASYLGPRWIDPKEEQMLFAEWDAIYRRIRQSRVNAGVGVNAPAESEELHLTNVIGKLASEHQPSKIPVFEND